MPDAAVIQYRHEYVASFEQRYSQLKVGCVRETVIKGNQAVFLVAGSGGETAVTRGSNGQIPYRTPDNTQNTCTLQEKHAPEEMTGFDIFANQGDQRRILMESSQAILHRDIDQAVVDQLDTATNTTGSAVKASLALVNKALTILGNNDVDVGEVDNMFAAITPAFNAYLSEIPEFASSDYVEVRYYDKGVQRMRRWNGINWMISTRLTGLGTASEQCYLWHRNSMGHAANTGEMSVHAGYDEKQDTSWTRATCFHNAKLLQNSGIIQMVHDGSEYSA